MFITFSLGLVRALIDNSVIKTSISEGVLMLHIIFAIITGGFGVYLYYLAKNTGLIFPKLVALGNISAIAVAGFSGFGYLLTNNDNFTRVMLYGFEISLAFTSMLVGYLYCYNRVCER